MNQSSLTGHLISPKIKSEIMNSPYLNKDLIEARDYQVDIAKKCIGNNFLVSIPTGLGKTIIAILVSAKTFENFPARSKIIMLAPTKPLVVQHAVSFRKFLNVEIPEKNAVLTGTVKAEKRIELFEERKILFYTPQTLRNDLLEDRYDLKDVCLIIFDEAHRASGKYAYCQIANIYNETNPDGNTLALTASPGANREKIELLCLNLYIPPDQIELRMRRDDDVKKYVQDMILFKIGVEMDGLMRKVLDLLREILDRKLTSLDRLGFLKQWNGEPIGSKEDLHKISQKHIIQLNREFVKSINEDRSKPDFDKSVYTALSVNAEVMKLFHMLKTVETQGLNVLTDYLDELKKESYKSAASKATKNLSADFMLRKIHADLNHVRNGKSERLMHPKIFKLNQLLVEEQEKNPNLRVLVFTELRNTVGVIVSQLNLISGLKPAKFVGQARKSKSDKGLSQKEQIALLEKFKAGEFNVLVSTSVAEEGLDIAECDMVVFYDAVPSEIRLIQRRGRTARNREGKVIILYCIGTSDERYLNISMAKLKAMQRSLGKNVQKSPKKSIAKKTKKIKKKESAGSNSQINEFLKIAKKEKVNSNDLKLPKNKNYILIDKNLPVKYGIRKGLRSKFQISDLKGFYSSDFKCIYPDITVKNILSVKILKLNDLLGIFGKGLERIDEDLRNFGKLFELSIFFIDRMGVKPNNNPSFDEIKNVIEKFDIQVIPSDKLEEIPLILNQIIKNIKNKYKIKV